MRKFNLITIFSLLLSISHAQMLFNGEQRFGNEWIEYGTSYLKFSILQNGIYKVEYQDLVDQGFPSGFKGSELQMISGGEELPILTSNEGVWGEGDYLLFYGYPNDGFIDRFHYDEWETEQLNPKYSMYADERIYFLSLNSDASANNLRYQELSNDLSGNLPPLEEFYMHREEKVFSEFSWSPAAPDVPDASYSSFIVTEGFGTRLSNNHNFNFNLTAISSADANAVLDIRTGSNTQLDHDIHISLNGNLVETDEYQQNKVRQYNIEVDKNLLSTTSSLTIEGMANADLTTVAHASIIYPRSFDALNKTYFEFELAANKQEGYYEIRKFNPGGRNYIFDVVNGRFLTPQTQNGVAKFRIGSEGLEDTKLVLVAAEIGLRTPEILGSVVFRDFDNIDPEYLILTSSKLNNDDNGMNPVQDYAQFRSSTLGGGYKVEVINVEELYDQFAFGVDQHAMAIRNFSLYIRSKWPSFKQSFLIGKALSYGNRNKNTNVESYVPTYGKPGSDNLLFADKRVSYPYVAVGRLAARNKTDVANYLLKVQRHAAVHDVRNASIEDRLWLKNIIHLSGGDPGIQLQLFNHLTIMEDIIEGGVYGGNVTTYRKISSDPIQTSLSQQILENINEGISILTFFGHSSAGTFDFSVEDPSEYENVGRLPMIFSMGCKSGDIHETVYSLSEDMILTKDRGAITFVASSGTAFPTPLSVMGKDFYSKISNEYYGRPIGEVLRDVTEDLFDPLSTKVRTLNEQNTLHGDPAVKLYNAEGPDYVVDFASITTNGEVGATDEMITVGFDIVNLGRGVEDSINNIIIHEYANGLKDTIPFRTVAPTNRIEVMLDIPNPGFSAIGKNVVEIVLDVDNRVQELPASVGEQNNSLKQAYNNEGYCFYIFDDSAFPVYPPDFGIVNTQRVELIASSTNALAGQDRYVIQIDTTELFDSPFLQQTQIESSPAAIKWTPEFDLENNTVYYWRVAPFSMDSSIWNGSSFVYLENSSEGWNQSHLYQWQKDSYETYSYDDDSRRFLYAQNLSEINIKNGAFPQHPISMIVQNDPVDYLSTLSDGEIPSGLYICTFDGITGLPWLNQPSPTGGLYGSELYTWWAQNFPAFPFRTDTPENRAKAIDFIENTIPSGNYILIYTIQRRDYPGIGNYRADEWASDAATHPEGLDLMSLLESYGAEQVRELEAGPKPYLIAFKKDDPEFDVREVIADNIDQAIELNLQILGSWFEGRVASTRIGPAVEWNRVIWSMDELDPMEDTVELDLYGITPGGQDSLLFDNIQEYDFDISSIDTKEFPYLRLELYSEDSESKTSAQMEHWRVVYKAKPEALIDIPQKYTFNSDTLFLGEKLEFCSIATNASSTDMDSLLVRYTVVDPSNRETTRYARLAPLPARASVELNFEYVNEDNLGVNQFQVEINPNDDQEEKYDFNNIGVRDYVVQGDRVNPVLDVTFDGMRIMDGDIVSPRPQIRIELRDENDYLRLDDLSSFDLSLQKVPENEPVDIDLEDSDIVFTPADSTGENIAVLEFFPELEEGEYTLFVQAEDISGNKSGDQNIEQNFVVIEDTRVSNVLNYPNPFSTSTEFIFTLTGYEIPEVFTIQIFTLSGKVVREITKEELGPLRIGINRTEYKWDGTDEYGSLLANGVYLYRVLTSFNDNEASQFFNEDIDGFFTKGFGKMVIMR